MSLSEDDRALLVFEESSWMRPGAKADAIRAEFGISASAYYRRLGMLVDSSDALEQSPLLVRRLRRRRSMHRRLRFEGAAAPNRPAR